MGGSVNCEITDRATHLVAYAATGEKYQYAVTFSIPVMGEKWINTAWAHRDELSIRAQDENLVRSYCILFKINLKKNFLIVILVILFY